MKTILFLLLLIAQASALTLGWNRNPETDIAGYVVSYGTVRGEHPTDLPLTTALRLEVPATVLVAGNTYFLQTSSNLTDWEAMAYVPLLKEYADRRFVRARITDLMKP